MSALIDVLRRDPEIIGVAEGLGVPIDDYVKMVADFIEDPSREVRVKLNDDDSTEGINEIAAWFRTKLSATFADSFRRTTKTKRLW
ncbi:MAG: hypothetical protein RMA76_25885 [Deltaproteobacteria bacterium]|jgi:hypothetical protein